MQRLSIGRRVASVDVVNEPDPQNRRGRPRLRSDEVILAAALTAFAEAGFQAMSVRALSASLGLSHEAVGQRFGSKLDLFHATIDFGMTQLYASLEVAESEPSLPADDLALLRASLRNFMIGAATHPELGRIINQESLTPSARLDFIVSRAVEPGVRPLADLLSRLADEGRIRRTTAREIFFLAQAGAAPFTMVGLSSAFDNVDGPFHAEGHIEQVADLIVGGLTIRHTSAG